MLKCMALISFLNWWSCYLHTFRSFCLFRNCGWFLSGC